MHSTMYMYFDSVLNVFICGFAWSTSSVTIYTINKMNLLISKDEPIFKH